MKQTEEPGPCGRGRPSREQGDGKMEYCIGIDLGGTNIAGGIATADGRLLDTQSVKTGMPCTPDDIANRIAALCGTLAQAAQMPLERMAWVGVGAPGSVDKDAGVVKYANNLDFHEVPLGAMLRDRLGLPVYLDNDANAAAWGEYRAGVGAGCASMVMVTLGTGVGGGIIENGRIVTGCNWAAGELGHFVIDMHGEPCNCGLRGCFEQYGSVTALIAQTRKAMRAAPGSLLWEQAGGSEQKVTGRTAFDAARRGDAAAKAVVSAYVKFLCVGITSIINIFQPEVLCMGGGISREGEAVLGPVREYVGQHGYARGGAKQTRIVAAGLAGSAGILGAALLGMEQREKGGRPAAGRFR